MLLAFRLVDSVEARAVRSVQGDTYAFQGGHLYDRLTIQAATNIA